MSESTSALMDSAQRGGDAKHLLSNPLLAGVLADMAEKTTQALLALPVEANDQRLALCTVLGVLRGMPKALQSMADTGEFDAARLAQLTKDT